MKTFRKYITEAFDAKQVRVGDLVDFGRFGKYYVTNTDRSPNYFLITKRKSDALHGTDKEQAIHKSDAIAILSRANEEVDIAQKKRVVIDMDEDASEDFERAKKELDNKKTEFKKKADSEKDRAKEQEFKEKQKESEQEFQEKQREDKQKREQKYKEQEDKKRDQERQQQAKKATAATSESIEDKFNKEFLTESANPTREELMKELRVLNSRLPIDVAVSTLEKKYNCRIVIPSGTFISHVKFN